MKIIRCQEFGPPENLERIEIDTPEPGPGDAGVRISAAGVGFVDGLMIQGLYQVKPRLPYFPGSEFAGVVDAVGPEVEGIDTGDRVLGMCSAGAFSDYVTVPARSIYPIPDNLSDATAAGLFINYATALYGLRDCGKVRSGETMLVLGAAGGVGSAAISVGKAMGLNIIAAASTEDKRSAALSFGADAAIDYTLADWRDALKETAPDGITLVYDPVGGDISESAFRSLSPGGRFLVVGFAAGSIPSIPLNLALLKRSSIVGVDWGGESRAHPEINGELISTLLSWIETGKLEPAAVTERSMGDFKEALKDQLAGQITGKLVLTN